MRQTTMKKANSRTQLLLAPVVAVVLMFTATAHAAAPGVKGQSFALTATDSYISQPDGQMVYS